MGIDITSAFQGLSSVLRQLISWLMSHGITFYGTFYSFFNIDIALLIGSIIITRLPIWQDWGDDVDD